MEYKDTVKTWVVTSDTGLKELVVNYIGERLQAEAKNKIDRVVEKTGLDEEAARNLLSGNDGNV